MRSVYISGSVQEKNVTADNRTEEELMQALAKDVACLIQRKTCGEIVLYLNRPEWSLQQIIDDSNSKHPLLHVSLHSNAGGGSGTETWCYGRGTNSRKFGEALQAKVVSALGLQDRGVKDGTIKNYGEIVHVKATSVICEVFFHDNLDDIVRFEERRSLVVEAVAQSILEWFGIPWQDNIEKANKEIKLFQEAINAIRAALTSLERELGQL